MATKQITSNTKSTLNGVKYFKLVSQYDGDYTKNCGLLGNEIDENFYFLRGYDIESVRINGNDLILTRVNGETLTAKLPGIDYYSFSFDKETGILTIEYPDGTVVELDGFLCDCTGFNLTTDSTLVGDGSCENPVGINPTIMTGQYSPVDYYLDLYGRVNMPDGDYTGQRILTREPVSSFGKLYTYEEVEAIIQMLEEENSGWRVPTIDDWNDLCNSLEVCEECKNHTSESDFHGCVAGKMMKSASMWKLVEEDDGSKFNPGSNESGFAALPVGNCSNTPETLNGLYEVASFWSSTSGNGNAHFIKQLEYDEDGVETDLSNNTGRFSLRLVKDGCGNASETEIILGQTTPIVSMPSDADEGYKQWTKVNISAGEGYVPSEWDDAVEGEDDAKAMYFISVWDGEKWHKHEMHDGDSVVIKDYDNSPSTEDDQYKEWRLINGELVNYDDYLISLVDSAATIINERIDELSAATEDISDRLNQEISARTEADEEILEKIDEISGRSSSLYGIYVGHMDDELIDGGPEHTDGTGDTAICFIYLKDDGTYDLTKVDVEDFLRENEFKDGLQVIGHEVSVKKDPTSEDYLSISSDGVKVTGINEAIKNAKSVVVEGSPDNQHLVVSTGTTESGETKYIITLTDVASESATTNELNEFRERVAILERDFQQLEERVNDAIDAMTQTVERFNAFINGLEGVQNEIVVNKENEAHITIGFADDAIFDTNPLED